MTIEPIAWVGERKTLLAASFAILCLVCYVRYVRTNNAKVYLLSLAMCVLAAMSKPTSIPLPMCMLLLDWWPLRRLGRRVIMDKVPFFVITSISAVITIVSQGRTAMLSMPSEYSLGQILLIVCHNIMFYFYKIAWPANLTSYYDYPDPMSLSNSIVLGGVVTTAVLIVLLLISLRKSRALLVGWLFFFVAISPTMGVIGFTIVIASDKYAYLPSVGLLIALAWLGKRVTGNTHESPTRKVVFMAAVLMIALGEIGASRYYLKYWRDSETHYRYMLALAPNVAALHYSVGLELAEKGKYEEAIKYYSQALKLDVNYAHAHNNMGRALEQLGRFEEAIGHYRQSLQIMEEPYVHCNLGNALVSRGSLQAAVKHYKRALKMDPDSLKAWNNLGIAFGLQDRVDDAIRCFRHALTLKPDFAKARDNLAYVLQQRGELDPATGTE